MIEHEFVQGGQIHEADLAEILDLTAVGTLEWRRYGGGAAAIGTKVDRSVGLDAAREANLLEVRAGYMPTDSSHVFNYVRLTDREGARYYVAEDENPQHLSVARRVLKYGLLAVVARGGRLSGSMEECASSEHEGVSGHIVIYSAAHGIPGAVMSGSERRVCVQCDHSVPLRQAPAGTEARR